MQQYDEWLIDFQVQHGRKPSDKEVAEAAKTGFALSSGLYCSLWLCCWLSIYLGGPHETV